MVGAAILNNNENTYYLFMTSSFHSGELITENGPYDLRVTLFAIFQGLGAEYWVHGLLFFAEAPCLALFEEKCDCHLQSCVFIVDFNKFRLKIVNVFIFKNQNSKKALIWKQVLIYFNFFFNKICQGMYQVIFFSLSLNFVADRYLVC